MSARAKTPIVVAGDIPASLAAGRLGLSLAEFADKLPALVSRGFPLADPTTGLFDLDAIDAWRKARHPHLFHVTLVPQAVDARSGVVQARLEALRHGQR